MKLLLLLSLLAMPLVSEAKKEIEVLASPVNLVSSKDAQTTVRCIQLRTLRFQETVAVDYLCKERLGGYAGCFISSEARSYQPRGLSYSQRTVPIHWCDRIPL